MKEQLFLVLAMSLPFAQLKKLALLAVLALGFLPLAHAQTTYHQTAGVQNKFGYRYLEAFGIPFDEGVEINWLHVGACGAAYACWINYTVNGVGSGFISSNPPVWGPKVTSTNQYGTCTLPGSIHVDFPGGTYDADLINTYVPWTGKGTHPGCRTQVVSGTLVLN